VFCGLKAWYSRIGNSMGRLNFVKSGSLEVCTENRTKLTNIFCAINFELLYVKAK
jgi:hypothetical protein